MKAWLKENEIPFCDTMFKEQVCDLVKPTSIKEKITLSTRYWPSMVAKY
jgi:hypothetical protein